MRQPHPARSSRPRATLGRVAAAVLALATSLTFAVSASPKAVADDKPTLKIAITSDIDSLNPFLTIYSTPIQILHQQFLGLTEWDNANKIMPGVAEKWSTSSDGKTWTYTIGDRKWSDGQAVTAKDAEFTYNSIMTNTKLQGPNGSLVTNFASVKATDDKTLVITLKQPQAANPGVNDIAIVPEHIWSKVDPATYADDGSKGVEVGDGPFVIEKYAKDQYVQLKANDTFYQGAPKVSGIIYTYYKDTDAAVQALKSGDVDLVSGLTAAQFTALKGQSGITTSDGAGRRYLSLAINPGAMSIKGEAMGNGNAVLKDAKVRRAISMAIDNKTLVDKVLSGHGQVGVTEEPPVYPDYFGLPSGTNAYAFDIAGANKILDDAGYAKGSDGVRRDKSGKPIVLRLMGKTSEPAQVTMSQFIVGWLKQIGITAQPKMVASSQVGTDSTLGNYDMYFDSWGIGPDPDFQLGINTCASRPNKDGSGNTSENNWCDPAFDKLYEQQHAELDPAKRADLVKQAYGVMYEANVSHVIYYANVLEAYNSAKFTDFQRVPDKTGPIMGQSSYAGLYSATPVSGAASTSSSSGGLGTGGIIGIVVAALAVLGIGGWLLARRGKASDSKE